MRRVHALSFFAALALAGTALAHENPETRRVQLGGFGEFPIDRSVPCLSDEERQAIRARIAENRAGLVARGLLPQKSSQAPVSFAWPLRKKDGLFDPGVHAIYNFVDQNMISSQLLDYNCGTRTYDLPSGYDHAGTDIVNWPFAWYKMDHDQVEIVAAATGTIVFRSNGNPDRSCSFTGTPWNAVYVEHADGSIAWYGHMKNLSLTEKPVGQQVQQGEYLGVVGSSGSSTVPHLHFEVYDALGDLIDPFAGPCNSLNEDSWWEVQPPYYDSAVNLILTHNAAPEFPPCPQQEILHDDIFFLPGETIYFAAYYRDQLQGQVSDYRVYEPDGGLFESWSHSSPASHYAASGWYWSGPLPGNAETGWWRYEVDFQGQTYEHLFYVGDPTDVEETRADLAGVRLAGGVPNPTRAGSLLEYELPAPANVRLAVRDVSGREVIVIEEGWRGAGGHRAAWSGLDSSGRKAPAGVYFAELLVSGRRVARKLVVTR